jgi:hypothetical protein
MTRLGEPWQKGQSSYKGRDGENESTSHGRGILWGRGSLGGNR